MSSGRNSYKHDNVFQKIIKGELPSKKVFEDEKTLAIHDINPAAPVHILVFPKGEFYSFDEFCAKSSPEQVGTFFQTVRKVAIGAGLQEDGFRIVCNHGLFSEQVVPHFHVHILGGRVLGAMTTVPDHQVDHGRVKKVDKKDDKSDDDKEDKKEKKEKK